MKKITILGSTGSIGTQTLDVIRQHRDMYSVTGLTCGRNIKLFAEQLREFKPVFAAAADEKDAERLRREFRDTEILSGTDGIVRAAADTDCDMVVNALVGVTGMLPTYRAVCAGKDIALANKETLVAGGEIIMKAAADNGVSIVPIDSEHSAVFQSLQGFKKSQVKNIILTASGGPFRGRVLSDLTGVTAADALKHPNWSMGKKITVDSSTLMNKGFEVIEARWLFDAAPENIKVVIHPESIIHSMVEYIDGAVMAQLGTADMRIPISYALGYPDRTVNNAEPLDLTKSSGLTFEEPDTDTFRCLKMAYEALKVGDTYCAALNAADEVCVEAFLNGSIGFIDIQETLEKIMDTHVPVKAADIDQILETDRSVRKRTRELLGI